MVFNNTLSKYCHDEKTLTDQYYIQRYPKYIKLIVVIYHVPTCTSLAFLDAQKELSDNTNFVDNRNSFLASYGE